MNQVRYCSKCKRELIPSNPGRLCTVCREKMSRSLPDEKTYYDVNDLMRLFGLDSEEQVRRLGRAGKIPGRVPAIKRHLYSKESVDNWIQSDYVFINPRLKPIGPLQEEAYRLCQSGDHSWMTEERFLGQACTAQVESEMVKNKLKQQIRYTCYFCGQTLTRPLFV
jgi:hypothetical protein